MLKIQLLFLAVVVLAARFVLLGNQIPAQAASLKIVPVADAYVTEKSPNLNKGRTQSLRTDAAPLEIAYIRLTVAGVTFPIQSASLRLYNKSSSGAGYVLSPVTDNSWTEDGLTYLNSPAISAVVIGTSGPVASNSWTSFDLTNVISANGQYSFAITTSSNAAVAVASRESGKTAPYLVIESDQSVQPSNTPTPYLTSTLTVIPGTSTWLPSSTPTSQPTPTPTPTPVSPALTPTPTQVPSSTIRAAFYYPWFAEAWTQSGIFPYTNYEPSLGFYSLDDTSIIQQHIGAMQYGKIFAGIASWWGQGHQTDQRVPLLLSASAGTGFKWTLYYEPESLGDPSVATIASDLIYFRDQYASDPSFWKIGGKFVVFVYADATDACAMADRWKQANIVNAYIVLKVFPGYGSCASQPDGWHQYAPAGAYDRQGSYSASISPGFYKVGEAPRLNRDLGRWQQNIRDMIASGAQFQLITTFNEWGEGTSTESALEWASASGYGAYLDALHDDGGQTSATPTPTSTGAWTATPTRTSTPAPSTPTRTPTASPTATPGGPAVLIAAGDIASCSSSGDEATALLLDNLPGTVVTLGDNAYESGSASEFTNCYNPTWGRQKARTKPSPGNHEYGTASAAGYFGYFGSAAGDPLRGYYSYDLGSWHIIAINSNCSSIGGCNAGSPQEKWLRADLAAHPNACTLAYWHHPRFSSGEHGSNPMMNAIWQALYDYKADVVLNGHDHDYERFAPQDANGVQTTRGIREFVVGTGGKSHYAIGATIANSQVHNDSTYGVLKMTLSPTSYSWEFIPIAGELFTDAGSSDCVI